MGSKHLSLSSILFYSLHSTQFPPPSSATNPQDQGLFHDKLTLDTRLNPPTLVYSSLPLLPLSPSNFFLLSTMRVVLITASLVSFAGIAKAAVPTVIGYGRFPCTSQSLSFSVHAFYETLIRLSSHQSSTEMELTHLVRLSTFRFFFRVTSECD